MKTLALALLVCSGCFVLPKTQTTTKDLGTSPGEIVEGPTKQVTLHAEQRDNAIAVSASAARDCARPVYQRTEIRKEKHARWSGVKDPRAGLFALLLAPVTVPITAIGTGFAILGDGDGSVTQTQRLVRTETFACNTLGKHTPLAVTLPSGHTLTTMTGDDGAAVVRIPESEPYRGQVSIDTDKAVTAQVSYARAMPAVTAVRETVYACAVEHRVSGQLKIKIRIDERGRASNVTLDAGDGAFAACVNAGIAATQFTHRDVKLVLPLSVPVAAL